MEAHVLAQIKKLYENFEPRLISARKILGRPLTVAEKIIFSHLRSPIEKLGGAPVRGKTFLHLQPDRVAMQDATAQMAILQFMVTGRDTVAVPSTVHCDHLIRAFQGAKSDLLQALDENEEVYAFLRSASEKYGIGFWKPGSGIIHQVILEQYAFPGGLLIGTDSHTPNAGGLGMIAIGVGGADATDVMAGGSWGVNTPKLVGVHLTGSLSGWTSAKDVILSVAGKLTVKGGTGKIVEYFGEGTKNISCTGKATITNMGAELGATTSVFPYDTRMSEYLNITERKEIAALADRYAEHLRPDDEVLASPEKYFDEIIEIDLNKLEPNWVGPHTPDLLRSVSQMKDAVKREQYPEQIRFALIGSCTNSSYEDIDRAASIAKQATARGLKCKIPLMVTPGSEQIHSTIERDGQLEALTGAGATVLANACGPCIGQWKRDDIQKGEKNTIITSYNRNFAKRNDGNAETYAFIGSPELVTAMAFSGSLSFNPVTDSLTDGNGKPFKFDPPKGADLPANGYVDALSGYIPPITDLSERRKRTVEIDPKSERLEVLAPFPSWDGKDMLGLVILLKARGKCTTDHISPAGPWLKYRGHLNNISNNCYIGAINAFGGEAGKGTNVLTKQTGVPYPEIARYYKEKGKSWVAIGDENYGEGSSREHAAMSPRYLGCKAVIAKSFARIAEGNLKRQGILGLTLSDSSIYDLIGEYDTIDIIGLSTLAPGKELIVRVQSSNGKSFESKVTHSMTDEEIAWFKAGSALNALRPQ